MLVQSLVCYKPVSLQLFWNLLLQRGCTGATDVLPCKIRRCVKMKDPSLTFRSQDEFAELTGENNMFYWYNEQI